MRDLATTQCAKGAERKHRRLAEEEVREISERVFQAYRELLENSPCSSILDGL